MTVRCHHRQYDWLTVLGEARLRCCAAETPSRYGPADQQAISARGVDATLANGWERSPKIVTLAKLQLPDFRVNALSRRATIIEGTTDLVVAKRVYTQYVGM